MQNSSLGVILATSHFPSPMVALPAAMSAVIMNIMGSSLGFLWRNIDPSESNNNPELSNAKTIFFFFFFMLNIIKIGFSSFVIG